MRPQKHPLFDPKIPPRKVYVAFFPKKNEANKFFSWGSEIGAFWVGGQKFMLKMFMCFFRPLMTREGRIVNFTLPGLRFHTLQTRAVSSLALSHPCSPPVLARPRPFLARSSPGPRPASPCLARPSPGLARPSPTHVSSNHFDIVNVKTGKRETC